MCLTCNDTGFIARAPEGDAIYCESCAKGLTKALRSLGAQLEVDRDWLARRQAEGLGCEREQIIFDLGLAEHERLRGLLQELERQDEGYELHALHV